MKNIEADKELIAASESSI